MRIVLLGAPGSGKGTQAQFITKKYHIPQISTGDILRKVVNSGKNLGNKVQKFIESGKLVPDELVVCIVKEYINQVNCRDGFILDGFPRTLRQARAMKEANINVDYILEFDVSDKLIFERVTGRRTHMASGRIYHVKFNPPQIEGKDDITGEALTIRKDDRKNIVSKRLKEYNQITAPLIYYYKKQGEEGKIQYHKINGSQGSSEVSNALSTILD